MKKILMVGLALMVIFLAVKPASAWWVVVGPRVHVHRFGVVVAPPPPVFWGPPVVYYRSYYPPPYYYYPPPPPPSPPPSNYSGNGYPVWVPGHWEERPTPGGGTESVWVPGYWQYGP